MMGVQSIVEAPMIPLREMFGVAGYVIEAVGVISIVVGFVISSVMCAASTGRRHDSTRPIFTNIKITLANREPSRHDPKRSLRFLL